MNSDFEKVANFADAFQAEHVLSVLQENGVEGFLDNVATQTALSYVGVATGGINLFVHRKDAEQARAMLDEIEVGIDHQQPPWFCKKCEVEVDGGFEVCWSCGEPQGDVGELLRQADSAPPAGESIETGQPFDDSQSRDSENPYAAPRSESSPRDSISTEDSQGWVSMGVMTLVVAMILFAVLLVYWFLGPAGP